MKCKSRWLKVEVLCLGLAACLASDTLPAQATRLPPDLAQSILDEFPDGAIRMDGAITTTGGELFLPVVPVGPPVRKKGKILIESIFPKPENPNLLVYGNGWCYLRVIKKGVAKTILLAGDLPDKLRKQLLSCRFPTDLIVPDNFHLPESLKAIAGEVAVHITKDAVLLSPDFGKSVVTRRQAAVQGPGLICLTSLKSGTITLCDERTMTKIAEFPTEGTPGSMVSMDNFLYISDQAKSRILILDLKLKQFAGQMDLLPHSAPKGLAILPNNQLIYVAESATNDIAVIETATHRVLMRTKVPPGPGKVALTPNGNFLVVLNVPSGQLTVLSTLNQKVLGSTQVGLMPTAVAISSDSRLAYVSNRQSNSVSVVDIGLRTVVATMSVGLGPTGVALSRDNSRLYVANARENSISVFDTKTKQKLSGVKLPVEVDFPGSISLTPDGKRLIVSSEASDTIAILNVVKMEFEGHSTVGHSSHDVLWVAK